MNLPKYAKNIISSISSLQTLIMDTIPKTAMIAGTTAQKVLRIYQELRKL